jgi:RNA polymerase sigma factor (TIGR02999 family)
LAALTSVMLMAAAEAFAQDKTAAQSARKIIVSIPDGAVSGSGGMYSKRPDDPPHEITQLLKDWSAGDKIALNKLMPIVYEDLHRLAQRRMALERDDHTLQTTALVHEAYMRLVDSKQATWKDRAHFFAVCARLMRQILVDAARSRRALKRGADVRVVELDSAMTASAEPAVDLIALDDTLNALTAFDARKGQVVEMRIFGGLSVEETVTRDMHMATAWLRRELVREGGNGT